MKTKEKTRPTFSDSTEKTKPIPNAIEVFVPASWQELTDKQLRFVYRLLGEDIPAERVMLYAFLRFAGLHIIRKEREGVYIIRKGHSLYAVSESDLICGAMQLDYIGQPSTFPLRVEAFNGHLAVNPDLREFPFGHYLQIEAYYQAVLRNKSEQLRSQSARHAECGEGWSEQLSSSEELLCFTEIAALLYPGFKGIPNKTLQYNLLAWLFGVKHLFASEFPDLFRPVVGNKDGENDWLDMKAITEAEIRALNGGDITKTEAVLAADTWGALAELNAKAKEAKELDRIRNK